MGLFNKNKKEEGSYSGLPELPKLPELPPIESRPGQERQMPKPNALPRFPSSPTGNRFSQNTIKDAVSGEKEGNVVNEFEDEIQKMPRFPDMPKGNREGDFPEEEDNEDTKEEIPARALPNKRREVVPSSRSSLQQNDEPIFVRLDKFEESMDVFDRIKKQLSGAEKLLNEIKSVKEREDKELGEWRSKMESMKSQIEKIDKDIFSKV